MVTKHGPNINDRKFIVDLLAVFFGIGAWIGINGTFVQLPLLVMTAPEGWKLPSYMSVAVQLANLGPIVYAIYRRGYPSNRGDKYWIASLLALTVVTMLLVSFFHHHITNVGGEDHSVFFLALVFCTALVGCTSSVLFFPFMRHYRETYLISYLIGEGLSGFIPSILALIQGIGGNPKCEVDANPSNGTAPELVYGEPRFSTQVFFSINAFVSLLSLVAFLMLVNLKTCREERVTTQDGGDVKMKIVKNNRDDPHADKISQSSIESSNRNQISRMKSANLLLLMSVVCAFGNGVFPSVQSYSCLPYGNTAYHLSVSLGSMANPVACFLALFLPRTSNRSISILTFFCAVFVGYILATSLLSPTPPLVDATGGVVIIVLVWIGAVGLVSYIKLCVSTIFRTQGGSWMFYCGSVSQLGSAIGSLIIFFLVNYAKIFKPSDPCR